MLPLGQSMESRLRNIKQLLKTTKLGCGPSLTCSKPRSQTGKKTGSKSELGSRVSSHSHHFPGPQHKAFSDNSLNKRGRKENNLGLLMALRHSFKGPESIMNVTEGPRAEWLNHTQAVLRASGEEST